MNLMELNPSGLCLRIVEKSAKLSQFLIINTGHLHSGKKEWEGIFLIMMISAIFLQSMDRLDSLPIYDLGYFLCVRFTRKCRRIQHSFRRSYGDSFGIRLLTTSLSHIPRSFRRDVGRSNGNKMKQAMSGRCSKNEKQDIHSWMQPFANL